MHTELNASMDFLISAISVGAIVVGIILLYALVKSDNQGLKIGAALVFFVAVLAAILIRFGF